MLAASALVMAGRLRGLDQGAVWQALGALRLEQVAVSLVAVAVAFAAVAGQERAIVAYLALPMAGDGRAALAAAAVSQTVGFGPFVGAIVRRRLMPDLTLGQSFAISAGITLGFFAGLAILVLASVAWVPGMPHRAAATGGLVATLVGLAWVVLAPGPRLFGLRRPNLFVLARFQAWVTLDLLALAVALWVVLPPALAPGFAQIVPVFLIALGAGVASGAPGGVGPFEATLLAWAPQADAAGMIAAIIAFRALAYGLPALCGALWAVFGPGTRGVAVPLTELRPPAAEGLALLPTAEAQLVRQGALALMAGPGWVWLSGALTHTRVMMGAVMAQGPAARGAALDAAQHLARSEARSLCLYKIDGRLAATARRRGHVVLAVAREAVLNPCTFAPEGPERARLRRKLAHARKAGVEVGPLTVLPLVEMATVVADWTQVHGRERGFSMGRWDAAYVAGQRVIAARSASGVLLAFVTFHAGPRDWVLDLVRFRPGTPDGTTYAMLCCALDLARAEGVTRLSLAAVPIDGFGLTGLVGRVMRRATRSSVGLAQFKSAFAPAWETRYAAAPNRWALVLGGMEVGRAILRPGKLPRDRTRLMVLRGGAGTRDNGVTVKRAA